MNKSRTLEDQLYIAGLIFLLVGGGILVFLYGWFLPHVRLMPCIWYEWFGFYCPGCGGTRAVGALLHGQILQSLWYHPLVPYAAVLYAGFMLSHTLEKFHVPHVRGWRFHNWYLFGAVGIIVVNFVVKNLLNMAYGITL